MEGLQIFKPGLRVRPDQVFHGLPRLRRKPLLQIGHFREQLVPAGL